MGLVRDIDEERSEEWKKKYRVGWIMAFSVSSLYRKRKDEDGVERIRIGEEEHRFLDFLDVMGVIYANNNTKEKAK